MQNANGSVSDPLAANVWGRRHLSFRECVCSSDTIQVLTNLVPLWPPPRLALHSTHSSKNRVYTEKEIVALSTKAGVNAGTCADVNQALVDDGLVDKAKIGGSNYFWSFPGKKDRQLQLKHEENLASIDKVGPVIAEAETKLADAKRGREDEDGERPKKLRRLAELTQQTRAATEELSKLKENDPQALADLDHELKLVYQAAERWTDNIFNCKSYLTKKRSMTSKEANRLLGISDGFDYPEMPKTG